MYNPKYTITNNILKSIGQIEAAKEVIENSPLIPSWERDFVKDAQIRTVHYSTHLEGNPLEFPEVKKIIEGYEDTVIAYDRDVYEVINYREAVKFIETLFEKSKKDKKDSSDIIDLNTIFKIHKILSRKILKEERQGKIRIKNADLISSKNFEKVLVFPKAEEISFLLKNFLSWLVSKEGKETHPVLKAGIVHYELTKIHPFDDQNGRTARTLSTLTLYLDGYDIKSFFSLDEHFDRNPMDYYNHLASVQEDGDLTMWLTYFCKSLSIELNRVKEKVLRLSKDAKLKGVVGQVSLNERQEKIINHIQDFGFINNRKWKKIFLDYSDDTVLRDLQDLIKKKIIKKVGKTKSARYVMR
ncbi:MAG: Fic family protein [bacterium]